MVKEGGESTQEINEAFSMASIKDMMQVYTRLDGEAQIPL